MNELNWFCGFRCDYGVGEERFEIISLPIVPNSSKSKSRHFRQVNIVRDFICAEHLPFIVTIGRDQAPLLEEEFFE